MRVARHAEAIHARARRNARAEKTSGPAGRSLGRRHIQHRGGYRWHLHRLHGGLAHREVFVGKVPTTRDSLSDGFFGSIADAAWQIGLGERELLARTERVSHGTTVGINAIVTRTGARVACSLRRGTVTRSASWTTPVELTASRSKRFSTTLARSNRSNSCGGMTSSK